LTNSFVFSTLRNIVVSLLKYYRNLKKVSSMTWYWSRDM